MMRCWAWPGVTCETCAACFLLRNSFFFRPPDIHRAFNRVRRENTRAGMQRMMRPYCRLSCMGQSGAPPRNSWRRPLNPPLFFLCWTTDSRNGILTFPPCGWRQGQSGYMATPGIGSPGVNSWHAEVLKPLCAARRCTAFRYAEAQQALCLWRRLHALDKCGIRHNRRTGNQQGFRVEGGPREPEGVHAEKFVQTRILQLA